MICPRLLSGVALVAALMAPSGALADSLVETLLRIAGLTVAPAQLRGPGDEGEAGSIWVANLDRQTVGPMTPDGGYRSPIFSPADGSLVALKDAMVVRVPVEGGTPAPVQRVAGVVKLVGFDSSPTLLEGLESGLIDSLVVQDPFRMGYDSIQAAVKKLQGGTPEKIQNLPPLVVTKENLNDPAVQKQLKPDLDKYLK